MEESPESASPLDKFFETFVAFPKCCTRNLKESSQGWNSSDETNPDITASEVLDKADNIGSGDEGAKRGCECDIGSRITERVEALESRRGSHEWIL